MALFSFAAAVASQIGFLLSSLNSANYKSVLYELGLLLDYGPAGNLLLQSCLEQGNLNEGEVQSFPINLKIELLGILIRYLIQQPNFSSIFTEAVRLIPYREDFVDNLAVLLKLSLLDQIGIGLALTDAEDPNWRRQGQVFCEAKILQLIKTPAPGVSEGVLDQILLFLYESEGLSEHVPEFVKALSVLQPKAHSSILLAPLLHDKDEEADCVRDIDSLCAPLPDAITADLVEQLGNAVNAADVMEELGYSCTVDVAHCKNILNLFAPLNETAVAKLVGMISRTHTGLVDTHGIHGIFCSALCNSATSYTSWLQTWNIDVLLEAIAALAPGISWVHVAEELDHKEFYLSDQKSFNLLLEIFRKAIQDPFPLEVVTQGLWKNSEGQLSFLRFAVKSAPELFSRQVPIEGLDVYEAPNDNSNHVWSSVALIKILCQLAEAGHTDSVRSLLEYPAKHFPETLILGLVQVKTVNNLMQQEIFLSLFPLYLGMNPINHSILQHIWSYNREMMMFGMVELYSRDTNIISRVLHTCQELKVLGSVLEATPFSFSIELAVLAYKKDLINLEKWLQEQLKVHRDSFFQACLNFLRKRTTAEVRADGSAISGFGLGSVFPLETLPTFLQVLQSFSSSLVLHDLAEEMKQVHAAAVRVNPHLNSVGPQEQLASEGFSSAIEDESNAYFQQIYAGEMMIQSALQMLESFKDSNSPRERKVFACMIQCLFDEYQYFPKYPDKELKITAVLFGSLIKHQLVSSLTLGMALRHVLDALRKPLDTKMFSFGLTALEQFLDRVVEWPQYCNHILQISHMREARDGIVEFIERGLARLTGQSEQNAPSMTPAIEHSRNSSSQLSAPNAVAFEGTEILQAPHSSSSQQQLNGQNNQLMTSFSQGFVRPRSSSALEISRKHPSTAGFGHAFNIETLVAAAERRDTPIEAPMQEVQDKIFFIINNISTANIDPKAKEILEFLEDQYDPWFAEYMVMKRASIEPNFHDLYLKFLDKINSKSLHKEIMKATYENCKVLLRSDLIKSSSEERSLLKNLGSWLGKLTIGRNQPLRAREIDPKVLIIEAYEKGLMIAVVPFTSKVLEPCQSSLAYQPPNPWTMGILALLAEIYALPNLKMNLKFDIEVLLKNLGVDMKDVKPTQLLASRQRDLEGNPDFSNKDLSVMHPLSTFSTTDANSNNDMSMENSNLPKVNSTINHSSSVSQLIASGHLSTEEETVVGLASAERGIGVSGLSHSIPSSSPYSSSQLSMPIPNLSSYVLVNPKLAALGPQLSRIVPSAMERAIREIISPVVDRSVTIACMTTRELVTKDFCLETDESRIRQSANLMVASLAGSLAHVTCKEPLRMAMTNHLRLLLQGLSITGDILEQAVLLVTNDNLDLGCAVIEKAATEKALHDLEEALVNVLAHRRKQAPGFYEAAVYAQRLPEALRPKPGRLSNVQQRVYEDFARLPWQNQSPQSSAVGSASLTTPSNMPSAPGLVRANFPGQNSFRMIPGSQPGVGLDGAASDEADPRLPTSLSLPSSGSILLVEGGARQLMDTSASFVPPESTTTEGFSPETNIMNEAPSTLPSSTPVDQLVVNSADQLLTTAEAMDKFETVVSKLDMAISKASARGSLSAGQDQDIQAVISEIPDIISKCTSKDETALACAQKILKRLYEQSLSSLHVSTHIAVLVVIRDACNRIVKELTSWVIYSDEEWKFNREIIVGLIRSELINLAEYNVHLANLMDSGRSAAAIELAIYLIQTLVIQEAGVTASEMLTIIDALAKIAQIPSSPPESLQQLLDIVKNSISSLPQESGTNSGKDDKLKLSKEKRPSSSRGSAGRDEFKTMIAAADPAGLQEQVAVLFEEWARICDAPGSNDKTYAIYISQLQHTGFLKGDDVSDRFFRILTELAVTHCLNSEMAMSNTVSLGPPQGNLFAAIDMYAKLVVLLVKYYSVDPAMSKVNLLNRVLSVTARVVQRDGDEKKTTFHPRPYFRLFVTWLMEFNTTESTLDAINFQVLTAFANTFVQLQPLRVPGFSFAWLELISHRMFMPKLLLTASQKGWPFVQRLLVSLFKFMEPYLRSAELNDPVRLLYKGSLRVLLVLLHDFPEFLCENHFSFCDVIPPSCIQMRNLILSAFPRNMRLPDPFTPNLKVDLLPEISQSPRISSDVEFALKNKQLKAEIDDYLKTRQPLSLRLVDLKQRLMLPLSEADAAGTRYNVPLINALVLYVGMQAIQQLQSKTTPQQLAVPTAPITHSAPMDIFQRLSVELDTEGRYLFLNAVANQLRYPNNHTHYFSCVLLYLFAEANQEIIQEQITRVLLERLIVNRPHPWGLLITFIELIKNPRYNFWNHSFVHCAPEIDKLFESVARSCMGPPMKSVEEDMASTIGVEGLKG